MILKSIGIHDLKMNPKKKVLAFYFQGPKDKYITITNTIDIDCKPSQVILAMEELIEKITRIE